MSNSNIHQTTEVWKLAGTQATLCTPHLTATLDLLQPHTGLRELVYDKISLAGSALGVDLGVSEPLPRQELQDTFLRGNDLVATYAETDQRPFSLQVYWRVTVGEHGAVALDAILSLQTDLLKSFPGIAAITELSGNSIGSLSDKLTNVTETNIEVGQSYDLAPKSSDAILLRSASDRWSYAEMTHPEDRGDSQIEHRKKGDYRLYRELGGAFLEKGVIRRLRIRGVFMPQENDMHVAGAHLLSLSTEQPPLTT